MLKKQKGLSKSPSQNQKKDYAGKRTLNLEGRKESCSELKKQYTKILPEFSKQFSKIGKLAEENISLLKKLDLQEDEEIKESLTDNTIITLTEGMENLQNLQASLQALTTELEKSKKKLQDQINVAAVLKKGEKEFKRVQIEKESKYKLKTQAQLESKNGLSYQYLSKNLQDPESNKPGNQVSQKTSGEALQEELAKNIRKTLPPELQGNFDNLLNLWEQRLGNSKSQNNEEKIVEEVPKKGNLIL